MTFQKIFYVNTEQKPWYKVLLWWEIRRIPYNVLLVAFGFLIIQLISILPGNGYFKLYPGPALVIWTFALIAIFFIMANICYSIGWIIQLLTRNFNHALVKKHTTRLFIYGLIISVIILFVPLILAILNIILPEQLLELVDKLLKSIFRIIN